MRIQLRLRAILRMEPETVFCFWAFAAGVGVLRREELFLLVTTMLAAYRLRLPMYVWAVA